MQLDCSKTWLRRLIKEGFEMKMEISWHKTCLNNRKNGIDRKRKTLERLSAEINKDTIEYNLYLAQIKLAEKEDKDGFDSSMYAIKRLTK